MRLIFCQIATSRMPWHCKIFFYYYRFAVGCSAYGIHFSAKFVNFDIFTVAAIKEAAVFAIILLIVPFFKRVGSMDPYNMCLNQDSSTI